MLSERPSDFLPCEIKIPVSEYDFQIPSGKPFLKFPLLATFPFE